MQEAAVTIVARMRDEASGQMQQFGKTLETSALKAQDLRMTLMATGSALVAIGSLMNKIESPAAKMASNFFLVGGAILSSASAIMQAIPRIISLINTLRSLAVVQSIVAALSGPLGWAKLAGAVAVGVGAYAATTAAMGGYSSSTKQVIEVRTDSPYLDDIALDKVARKITESQRRDAAKGR